MVVHSFLVEVLMTVASYVGVFVLTIIAINWLLGGLFKPYIRVRGSRGKLVLVKVKNIVSDYFVVGSINEKILNFVDRKKQNREISITGKEAIYRSMAVSCIDIDDEKNAVIMYNSQYVTGFDAVKFSDLHERALMKPSLIDNKQIIMIILLVVVLLGVIILGAMMFQQGKIIKGLVEVTKTTISTIPK